MDLFGIVGTTLRRWYVFLPIMLVATLFAVQSYQAVEPRYSGSVSVVVLPSLPPGMTEEEAEAAAAAAESDAPNPYGGSGGTRFAAAVLSRNINGAAFANRLDLPDDANISFSASASQQQPMIRFDAEASNPEAVVAALDAISTEANVVLNEFQAEAGAPQATRYRVAPAVPVGDIEDVTPSRMRNAGAILVMGLVAGAVAATVVDSAIARRRREAAARTAEGQGVEKAAESSTDSASIEESDATTSPSEEDESALAPAGQSTSGTAVGTTRRSGGKVNADASAE